jgi:site-specific DNA-cytosine methylase
LKGMADPVLYCDIAPECHHVLAQLMARNRLPKCPISDDVKTLNRSWVLKHGITVRPDMIVGGFPCTSVSTMGNMDGFKNIVDGSGLFYQILRLADELKTPLLFLENVENILNMEMGTIVRELVHKRGYSIRWCVNSGKEMGAPHTRKRWFCLAYKDTFKRPLESSVAYKPFNWNARSEPERTVCGLDVDGARKVYKRHGMLGNSVVPDAVRYAFMFLWCGMHAHPDYTHATTMGSVGRNFDPRRFKSSTISISNTNASNANARVNKKKWPKCGSILASIPSIMYTCEKPKPKINPRSRYAQQLVFDPSAYVSPKPPSDNMKLEVLKEPVTAVSWSTLRRGITRSSNYITARSVRDLPTQVRFEVKTRNRECPVNPAWTEFLMGYPKDWTRF